MPQESNIPSNVGCVQVFESSARMIKGRPNGYPKKRTTLEPDSRGRAGGERMAERENASQNGTERIGGRGEGEESDTHFVRPVSCAALFLTLTHHVTSAGGRHGKYSDNSSTLHACRGKYMCL